MPWKASDRFDTPSDRVYGVQSNYATPTVLSLALPTFYTARQIPQSPPRRPSRD
jgi:hypothetical protein